MTLHLRCSKCDFLDIVLKENAIDWKCPNCIINFATRHAKMPFRKTRDGKTHYPVICNEHFEQSESCIENS